MRTTLRLPDELLEEAKRSAFDRGISVAQVLEAALREHLARHRAGSPELRRRELPTFAGRGPLPGVDLHDHDALADTMDGFAASATSKARS